MTNAQNTPSNIVVGTFVYSRCHTGDPAKMEAFALRMNDRMRGVAYFVRMPEYVARGAAMYVKCNTYATTAAEAIALAERFTAEDLDDARYLNVGFDSKTKRAHIKLRQRTPRYNPGAEFTVYALDGHELLPATQNFNDETAARRYANALWRRY